MTDFKVVTRNECLAFVKAYPRELVSDITGIVEPPCRTWNDFTLGDWPESIVAMCSQDYLGPNGEVDLGSPGKFWKYKIAVSQT